MSFDTMYYEINSFTRRFGIRTFDKAFWNELFWQGLLKLFLQGVLELGLSDKAFWNLVFLTRPFVLKLPNVAEYTQNAYLIQNQKFKTTLAFTFTLLISHIIRVNVEPV